MATPSNSLLRRVFLDICRGFSASENNGSSVWIKHLTDFEQSEAEQYYEIHFSAAQLRGILTRDEKYEWLCQNQLWNKSKDNEIKSQKEYLDALRVGLTKAMLKIQVDAQKKTIAEEQRKYDEMVAKREELFGLTAESYAQNKIHFYYVHLSFYSDEKLEKRLYSIEDMDQMSTEESYDLLGFYIRFIENFSQDNIRRISITPYFMNALSLCGDHLGQFFGKPIVELTTFQNNLLSSGFYFKTIMQRENVPDHLRDDPDKIEEFINQSTAIKERIAKMGKEGSVGLIGGREEDFKAAGVVDDRSFMRHETNMMKELKLG